MKRGQQPHWLVLIKLKKMKNKLIYTLAIVAIAFNSETLLAQKNKVSDKCLYYFDKLEKSAPWIVSENGAGLVFNSAQNFSSFGAFYGYDNGEYKNYYDPSEYNTFGISTKSYVKVKDVYYFGELIYDYGIKQNQAWLGTIYPNTTNDPIVDSIPGKVLREDYYLNGKIGYPLSDQISIGLGVNYHTATAAKRTDGRNRNTLSSFNISPGIVFNKGILSVGLNLSYKHDVERVDYEYLGDKTGKSIYYMEGLFFYSKTGITSTTILERGYFKDYFGGALQVELRKNNVKFFNQLKVDYNNEDDYEGNSLLKRYAYTDGLKYDYSGTLSVITKTIDNYLKLGFTNNQQFSYNVITNYELVPNEISTWDYFEYGKTLRYMVDDTRYSAEYKGFLKRQDGCKWNFSWIFTLGANYNKVKKDYKIYPAIYHQDYENTEIYANILKNFRIKDIALIDVDVEGSYVNGDGTMLEYKNPITTGSLLLNNSLLQHDFAYRTADRAKIGGGVKYTHILNATKGMTAFCKASYTYQYLIDDGGLDNILDGVLPGTYKSFVNVSIGLNF